MKMQNVIHTVYVLVINLALISTSEERVYQNDIKFVFFNERNESISQSSTTSIIVDSNDINIPTCTNGEKQNLAIIVHGWTESCKTIWVTNLMRNLNTYRKGCIACMDYSTYSMNSNYYGLVRHFNGIATVLTNKLREFRRFSFDPNNIYMFGFSFGGQLVLEAGRQFGEKLIKQIDVCEPAGPGFDNNIKHSRHTPRISGQNVQCIHTSSDKGTKKRDCHQNWNMGNCGNSQIAAGPKPLGSHGLCPYFYNSAFQHKFFSIPKPKNCRSTRSNLDILVSNFSMGYLDALKYNGRFPEGKDFFADTFKNYPYNQADGRIQQILDYGF